MTTQRRKARGRAALAAALFIAVNLVALFLIRQRELYHISSSLCAHAADTRSQFEAVMEDYERSFQLFTQMLRRDIQRDPDPESVLAYLKGMDATLLDIEGETYDGLYMYYQGRYLYSWDTPYSVYEQSGYEATQRPWYLDAAAGGGEIVFTPPYMSYANHYILTTISQLQPDGETVFAYDIKMGDIQALVSSRDYFNNEQVMIFDRNGTIIGSTNTDYLGGDLYASLTDTARAAADARTALESADPADVETWSKAQETADAAQAFSLFRQSFDGALTQLLSSGGKMVTIQAEGERCYARLLQGPDFSFLVFVPALSALGETLSVWLVPLLVVELLAVYVLGRIGREAKNRELKAAYVELGQTQRRLELALSAAQKAAAVDELTGMMNFRSFHKSMAESLEAMDDEDRGIFIMIDGDHFKSVNDTYGHNVGDEVIKLSAQMIVGRVRTVDLASRLHGDEFAIFVSDTQDCDVARRIIGDINRSIAKEAPKRGLPSITLSAGAVVARRGDTFPALSSAADQALYRAKETHDGGFACAAAATDT